MKPLIFIVLVGVALLQWGCAEADTGDSAQRPIAEFGVLLDQSVVLPSSVLHLEIENSAKRESTGALVRFTGDVGGGELFDREYYVPVIRNDDGGNLVVVVRVFDGLFDQIAPDPRIQFSGNISIELDDQIGTFGRAYLNQIELEFIKDFAPEMESVPTTTDGFVNELIPLVGTGFLRPEEGTTWAVVDEGAMRFPDGSSRPVSNARVALVWQGNRGSGAMPVSPAIFGVKLGTFEGQIHFESQLKTGERFDGSSHTIAVALKPSRIDRLSPDAGSRGQKITVFGRGFVPTNDDLGYGMYFLFEGTFDADDPDIPDLNFEGASAFVKVPFRVVEETIVEQDVWYEITENGRLDGLGATPGVFVGSITPVLFDAQGEQAGEPWTGSFQVLPTKQVVYLKYLPGFSKALQQYGLQNFEPEIRDRVHAVLTRDYEGVHLEFRDSPPGDFVEYTTIEIGGPDPSGLLNFGYDNSFNDGGKDIGNLYLGDYLGGVNRHSQTAGYLPYGGVFIESFIAFSPRLFPDNFGTSELFDDYLSPFMPGLGGLPANPGELSGDRASVLQNAIDLIGNLTGHTASHEIGHSIGLAYFSETVEGFDERFHNDPPGEALIMDAGSDRPFAERAEIEGKGPARFSPANRGYLERVLPRPE